ncbi:uncharacterized protein MELLADRAFT_86319 [Melampsora larici-populina 98AG31]|uniref:GCM domain-containing protein n=1 Tax=Melampsora larici-populina (strain 98AG31 / pathotype 3-4-7) TaxID=747676 RepID=F4RLB4_MELLP|nr:uncharacterized protein MELLADRAFT_86319 [Melampsora larici-populina 98AG31]EGG06901.1 hypothetical protein MELLADRAFT_86319 [Melampsora larici-populina 98AG31]
MSDTDSDRSLEGPAAPQPMATFDHTSPNQVPISPGLSHVPETPSPVLKLKRRLPKKKGKKFKIPVPATGELQTFIDHGCTIDPQGYPIYPNGETIFVQDPIAPVINFGHVAFSHTQKSHGSKTGPWKTIWYKCLGVLQCDDDFCNYAGPPPTAEGKAAEFIAEHPVCPAVKCNGNHFWTDCNDTSCRVDIEKDSGWAVLCHSGVHKHPWPASKKADPMAMMELTKELVKNPKAGPLVLKVGQAGTGQTVTSPVINIHPAFSNGGRLGYLRRKVLVAKGLMPKKESKGGGDRLIIDLMHWGRNGLQLISTSLLGDAVHITFQTEWMAEQLVRRDQFGKIYSGGLLSDVTYRFFKNGYLLTTSMYSEVMHRWIPIQLTWMWGLDVNHYRAHFTTLLKQIYDAELSFHERDLLSQQVVDFSAAQKKGFIAAYMDVFNERDPAKALDKLKGCHEHYRQSITRVKKNWNIVDASQVGNFEHLAYDLLEPVQPGGKSLGDKFDHIFRLFPKAKAWLDWWNTADIHSMLFTARVRLPLDDPPLPDEPEADVPDTTNGQESMHRQYYILSSGQYTIMQGFIQLLLFVKSLNRDYDQLRRGIPVKYGSNWDSVVETLGWSKERTRRRPDVNDGRPPDTTEALLPLKKLGRPAGSANVNRDPHSSYQAYSASNKPGKQNRCWETATLEALFPTFSPLWIQGTDKSKDITSKLIRHYSSRVSSEMHRASHIKSVLSRGLKSLQTAIQQLSPDSFVTDAFCSADLFMDYLLMNKKHPTSAGQHFAYDLLRNYQCSANGAHQETETVVKSKVLLTTDLFHEANIRYSDVTELLSAWQSNGLFSVIPRCCTTCLKAHAQGLSRQPTATQPDEDAVSENEVTHLQVDPSGGVPRLYERCRLDFSKRPINVYFLLGGVGGLGNEDRASFMGYMNWPETIRLDNVDYEIVSCGFWAFSHYWCKLVRHVDGVRGVWFFDDRKDDGRAQLLGRDLSLIAGDQPYTSWVIYSCKPNIDEQKLIERGIAKITLKNPDPLGDVPFVRPDDLEGLDEQIDKLATPSVPSVPPVQGSANMAKQAFASAVSSQQEVLAVDSKPAIQDEAEKVQDVISRGSSQSDKARRAFGQVQKDDCALQPDTAQVDVDHRTTAQPIEPSPPVISFGAECDGGEDTLPNEANPTSERLILRLRNKRTAPEGSPAKSPSASPSSVKKVTKGKKRAKARVNKPIGPLTKGLEAQQAEQKPKAKGKKKK